MRSPPRARTCVFAQASNVMAGRATAGRWPMPRDGKSTAGALLGAELGAHGNLKPTGAVLKTSERGMCGFMSRLLALHDPRERG